MTHKSIFILLSILCITLSCGRNPLDVDASNTKVDISYYNIDSLLMHSDSSDLAKVHAGLKKNISELYDYQVGYCLQIGNVNDSSFVSSFLEYKRDTFIQKLENELATKFKNTSTYQTEITLGFKYLKTHLPTVKTPKSIGFMNSLFASNAFSTQEEIGIGMERYLGANSPSVQRLPSEPFYSWVKEGMEVKYLERDAMASWIMTHIVEDVDGNLAEKMIRWGKVLYLTEAAYPNKEKQIILRYSEEDYKWAIDNEASLWKYLIDEQLLFKLDEKITQNMLSDGPFTPGLPEKGPDRLGQYLGWRMVKNFMESTETSFEDLLKMPYNEILQAYEVE